MSEIASSGTVSKNLHPIGRAVICDLFPGYTPMNFTIYLEQMDNGAYRLIYTNGNPWGNSGGEIPFRKEDLKRLRDILNKLKL